MSRPGFSFLGLVTLFGAFLALMLAAFVPARARAQAAAPLTNDDVIKMVQAQLPDAVVVAKIKSSPCKFDTSTDTLIKLKQAGVSDAVLQAMAEGGSAPEKPAGSTAASSVPTPAPHQIRLEEGTPVKLRLSRTISSADAQVDERVDFEVLEEVKVGDTLVIPKGGLAWGTVTEAQPKRRMGRGGKLDINIDSVRLADGEKAALRGTKDVRGGGHTGAMTAGIVATSLIVWPAAPFFLFMHGKDITIPKGTEITTYVNGDMNLEPVKFSATPGAPPAAAAVTPQPSAQPSPPPAPAMPAADLAAVVVRSTPDGADITVDGKYVGSTPSTVRLAPGEHGIIIEKSGFKQWQRTISVNPGGTVTIDAGLEKAQ